MIVKIMMTSNGWMYPVAGELEQPRLAWWAGPALAPGAPIIFRNSQMSKKTWADQSFTILILSLELSVRIQSVPTVSNFV